MIKLNFDENLNIVTGGIEMPVANDNACTAIMTAQTCQTCQTC